MIKGPPKSLVSRGGAKAQRKILNNNKVRKLPDYKSGIAWGNKFRRNVMIVANQES